MRSTSASVPQTFHQSPIFTQISTKVAGIVQVTGQRHISLHAASQPFGRYRNWYCVITLLSSRITARGTASNKSWSKKGRSRKYAPHSMVPLSFEWINSTIFNTHQLSKVLWSPKTSAKDWDIIEVDNISKFHPVSWTINRDHIQYKFSFKLGLGF